MVTPFVASPGSDRVSRSNPGSWLILRPAAGTWKPWGRLEAWRERGGSGGLGYRFELVPDTNGCVSAAGIVLSKSTLSSNKGGKFLIDLGANSTNPSGHAGGNLFSPACSPRSSGDFGYGLWPYGMDRGFVMSAHVEGEGRCSKPTVEVSVQHVNCTEDAAAFVALAAAIDLSMDACRLFSHRLRKELCHQQDLLAWKSEFFFKMKFLILEIVFLDGFWISIVVRIFLLLLTKKKKTHSTVCVQWERLLLDRARFVFTRVACVSFFFFSLFSFSFNGKQLLFFE